MSHHCKILLNPLEYSKLRQIDMRHRSLTMMARDVADVLRGHLGAQKIEELNTATDPFKWDFFVTGHNTSASVKMIWMTGLVAEKKALN